MILSVITVGVLLVLAEVSAQGSRPGHCPLASTVKQCTPRCTSDWQCLSSAEKCCPNLCGSQSCARPSSTSVQDKYSGSGGSGSGSGVYCGNTKCRPGQTCKADRSTSRPSCSP
ncbi:waprin-Thr1 [Schistocerca cancellata]|uniref:waprin-Thr1 n=1 Tax=Schistocerca cancellata TaxID=274614 RepID=UPI00211882CF|nr:waprin-Thr1 [Schistocerca cancellata]